MKPFLRRRRCASALLTVAIVAASLIQATPASAQTAPRFDNQTPHFPPVSPVRSRVVHPPPPRSKPPTGYNTGMPFGLIDERELERLQAFAQRAKVDLLSDVRAAYQGDEVALARHAQPR